jgi:Uma2 family endonuclease
MENAEDIFQRADEAGIRLEIIGGLPVWEVHPNLTHQEAIDRIRQTITPSLGRDGQSYGCLHYADLHIKFPDGSDKRPDISIFCRRPSESESAVTEVPEAVVEIISRGYEAKDLQLGPPFYLGQGVKDVLVFDPYAKHLYLFDSAGKQEFESPVKLELKCGCQITI